MESFRKYLADSNKAKANIATVFIIGVFLVIISNTLSSITNEVEKEEVISVNNEVYESAEYEVQLENKLEDILSLVSGAGKVECMITFENSKEVVFAKDIVNESSEVIEKDSQNGERTTINESKDEKLVFGNSSEPVIIKELVPKVSGVVIVAEGGSNAHIKKSFVDVATSLLGVESHKVQILKMN